MRNPLPPPLMSDDTMCGKMVWKILKNSAMDSDYKSQTWYSELSEYEKRLLELLREAQEKQGNRHSPLKV